MPLLSAATANTLATLLVPRDIPAETLERVRSQVAPALAALVAVALHRDAVQAEAVETAALRRSDDLKTALLRAVSHDLRTPLTAIVTAGHALGSSLAHRRGARADERGSGRGGRAALGADRQAL